MRPMFPFYGSKWNLARFYPRPRCDVVIEPFAGAAGYSTFYGVERVLLLDADPIIRETWRYLISATGDDIEALPDLPNAGDSVDEHELSDGARYLIGFWLNRGSATPKRTRTAYSARTDRAQLNWGPRAKERIASQLEMIRHWEVIGDDYRAAPDVVATWLIDPPYIDKGRYYRVPFTEHAELAAWSIARQGQVIVCEGPGVDWLPFQPLGEFKTTRGTAGESVFILDW